MQPVLNPVEAMAKELGVSVDAVLQARIVIDGREMRLVDVLARMVRPQEPVPDPG